MQGRISFELGNDQTGDCIVVAWGARLARKLGQVEGDKSWFDNLEDIGVSASPAGPEHALRCNSYPQTVNT